MQTVKVVSVVKICLLSSVALVSLALAACTQSPADIVYKGSEFFGREHEDEAVVGSPEQKTYSNDAPKYRPGYARSVESAEVPEVAVADLPPPSANGAVMAKQEPAAGSKQEHVLRLSEGKPSQAVEVKEQQVASLSSDIKPAHKEMEVADVKEAAPKFIWPVDGGKIISRFKPSSDSAKAKGNDGINISMAEGEPIFAAAGGTVVYAGSELKGYGNMVIIRHDNGWMTAYAHARSLTVKKNEKVKQGAMVGYVGTTGGVKEPQVHFAMRKGKTPVDPVKYLPNA